MNVAESLRDLPRLIREYQERQGICQRCNGMGGSYTGGLIRSFSRNCSACQGTGRVRAARGEDAPGDGRMSGDTAARR